VIEHHSAVTYIAKQLIYVAQQLTHIAQQLTYVAQQLTYIAQHLTYIAQQLTYIVHQFSHRTHLIPDMIFIKDQHNNIIYLVPLYLVPFCLYSEEISQFN